MHLAKMLRSGYFIQMMQLRGTSIWLSQCKYYNFNYWNRFIVITCFIAPYSFAFPENFSSNLQYLDYVMSTVFAFDILFNFFTSYQDDNYNIIDDHKVISGFLLTLSCRQLAFITCSDGFSSTSLPLFHSTYSRIRGIWINWQGSHELVGCTNLLGWPSWHE